MDRRQLLKAATAGGALVAIRPHGALAQPLGTPLGSGALRRSKLFEGTFLVHSDLHNHTMFSDGTADPEVGFADMRRSGLDVAAFTDHAVFGRGVGLACAQTEVTTGENETDCSAIAGIDEAKWLRCGELADAADAPGGFTAIRGFEWTSQNLGHVNVWYSGSWTDPLTEDALIDAGGASTLVGLVPGVPPEVGGGIEAVSGMLPSTISIDGFYDWLKTDPGAIDFTGGGALFGFNHPGEFGNFSDYVLEPDLVSRLCSIEMHNLDKDYFFFDTSQGRAFPLNACLNAGWRPGILGVSDEHGPALGNLDVVRGRGGIWVDGLSRAAVRDGMAARRMFSTDIPGLRLDVGATSSSVPGPMVRMGSDLVHRDGPIRFAVDLAGGPAMVGRPLLLQVLTSGPSAPTILDTREIVMAGEDDDPFTFEVPVSVEDTGWVVLRITDPGLPPDPEAAGDFAAAGAAIAYASPVFLQADQAPTPTPTTPPSAAPGPTATPTPPTASGGTTRPPTAALPSGRAAAAQTGTLPATGGGAGSRIAGLGLLAAAAAAAAARRPHRH